MEKKINLEKEYLDGVIELFIQGIENGPFKGFETKDMSSEDVVSNNENKDIFRLAVDQAWLDVCRTFPNGDADGKIRQHYGEKLREAFCDDEPINVYNLIFADDSLSMLTVGQRQKIINMALKYLFCCENFRKQKNKFENAHMPLDSFTLEWFKRIVAKDIEDYPEGKNKLTIGMISNWSAIKGDKDSLTYVDEEKENKVFYSYIFYQENIKKYIETNIGKEWSPLEIEFFVWPETQLLLATEAYIFEIDQDAKRNEIRNNMSLTDKLDMLKEKLSNRNRNVIWFD